MTDVLSDILDTVELKATVYFRTEFHPPFGIAVPSYRRAARFHLIVQGQCFVRLDDGTIVTATPGDLVFVPGGQSHLLSSEAQGDGELLDDVIAQAGFVGQGPFVVGHGAVATSCQMVCGHFDFAEGADHPLLGNMPAILHITMADRARLPLLDDILRLIVRRAFTEGVGAASSMGRMSEALFIEVMRGSLPQLDGASRVMAAVNDPQIGKALSLVHADVARPWTVESLASAVGMSRSRFAERFRELVGNGPMSYVTEWRLQRALKLLSSRRWSVKGVAGAVGFQSAAAFSRAFADRFGRSPRDYRKEKS